MFPSSEKNSFLTKIRNEWNTTDTCLVSGTPANWMATSLLRNGEKKTERPGGIELLGCSLTYLGETSSIDLFCGNAKLALNRKISLKLPKMPFAAIVEVFLNIFCTTVFFRLNGLKCSRINAAIWRLTFGK